MPLERPSQEELRALVDEVRGLGVSTRRLAQALDVDQSTIYRQLSGGLEPSIVLFRAIERERDLVLAQKRSVPVRIVPVKGRVGGRLALLGEVTVPGLRSGEWAALVEGDDGEFLIYEVGAEPEAGSLVVVTRDEVLDVVALPKRRREWDELEAEGVVVHGVARKRIRVEDL